MPPGVAGGIAPRFWRLVEIALRGSCDDLQLRGRFKKSLSICGEVGLLAGD
jgi:hypothetical protein